MDDEQNQTQNAFRDRQSFLSRLSSNRSIDRFSDSSRSLNKKRSILEVLDIDEMRSRKLSEGRESQVDSDSINRAMRFSGNSNKEMEHQPGNRMVEENYHMFDEIPNFTESQPRPYHHECVCLKEDCTESGCPCLLAVNELCIIGLCCSQCITKKNLFLSNQSPHFSPQTKQKKQRQQRQPFRTNNHLKAMKKANRAKIEKEKYDFVYCNCKKTQCLKKYCPCYALNKQCNECCICEECQNCEDDWQEEGEEGYVMRQIGEGELGDRGNLRKKKKVEDMIVKEIEGSHFHLENPNNGHPTSIQQEKPIEAMIEDEIDNYFQDSPDDYQNVELNKVMDFEPVDFAEFSRK